MTYASQKALFNWLEMTPKGAVLKWTHPKVMTTKLAICLGMSLEGEVLFRGPEKDKVFCNKNAEIVAIILVAKNETFGDLVAIWVPRQIPLQDFDFIVEEIKNINSIHKNETNVCFNSDNQDGILITCPLCEFGECLSDKYRLILYNSPSISDVGIQETEPKLLTNAFPVLQLPDLRE